LDKTLDDGSSGDSEEIEDGLPIHRRIINHFSTFNIYQEAIIEPSIIGFIYYFIVIGLIALIVLTYYHEMTEPETYVSGFLEGRVYSGTGENIRIWEVADTLIPGYPEEQVFVPTIIRETAGQRQAR
jgi:hypothetical protein